MKPDLEREFVEFASVAMPALRRIARASSRDHHRADDLVQTCLEKLYVAWPRVSRADNPMAYARTTLVRSLIDEQRRGFWRREVVAPDAGLQAATPDQTSAYDTQDWVLRALATLTPRQRVAIALRHLEGLSVAETAAAMNTHENNVKAATREGMEALRRCATSDTAAGSTPTHRTPTSGASTTGGSA